MIYLSQFLDKTVLVLGLGRTGMSLVLNLLHCHCRKIYTYDDNPKRMEQIINGQDINSLLFKDEYHSKIFDCSKSNFSGNDDFFRKLDYIIVSPGVPLDKHPVLKKASKFKNVKITGDIAEFMFATKENIHVAVSGTNGKSTTCALTNHVLSEKYDKVELGGNIGRPAPDMIYYPKGCHYILELSSFQLDTLQFCEVQFDIAGVTNITEDHQDRYDSFDQYVKSKESIYKMIKKGGYALFADDCPILKKTYHRFKVESSDFNSILLSVSRETSDGISIIKEPKGEFIIDNVFNKRFPITRPQSLRGEHNAQNIIFAYAICAARGVEPEEFCRLIKTFRGLEHRLEKFFETKEAIFIDDSKATNTDAMLKSLSAFDNIILILGGLKKDEGLSSIERYHSKIKKCFVIGEDRAFYTNTLKKLKMDHTDAHTIVNAVSKIKSEIKSIEEEGSLSKNEKYTVLLSPAAASMDQFANYMQRGKVFKECVLKEFGN